MGNLFTISFPESEVKKAIRASFDGGGQKFRRSLTKALNPIGARVASNVIKRTLTGGAPVRYPNLRRRTPLGVRTGTLRRSVISRVESGAKGPLIRVGVTRGPALKYAGILEHGGIIRPVSSKSLAIPTGDALTASGVARYASPRDYPGELSFIPIHRGRVVGILVDKSLDAEGQRPGALWFLLSSVRIPKFAWLSAPVYQSIPQVRNEIESWLLQYSAKI